MMPPVRVAMASPVSRPATSDGMIGRVITRMASVAHVMVAAKGTSMGVESRPMGTQKDRTRNSEIDRLLHRCRAWLFRTLANVLFDPYRPELHYMRGPGPKWRAKYRRAR